MPLFQPSNITPSSFAGVGGGTVAASENVKISWQVNGTVPMTGFRVDIFDLENNRIGGTSGIVSVDPFYPTDKKGNPNYYTISFTNTWADWGIVDGNEYTMQITQYWTESSKNDNSVSQYSPSAFISRTIPTLQILTEAGALGSQTVSGVSQTYKGVYSQAQKDSIELVRWKFYSISNGEDLLFDDTGFVNTQILTYTANNMINGGIYKLVCTVQTESGYSISQAITFSVQYELPKMEGTFSYDISSRSSILLSWENINQVIGDDILGNAIGLYSFQNGRLLLESNSVVNWNTINGESLSFSTPWTVVWKGSSNGFNNGEEAVSISSPTTLNFTGSWNPLSNNLLKTTIRSMTQSSLTDLFVSERAINKIYGNIADPTEYYSFLTGSEITQIVKSPSSTLGAIMGNNLSKNSINYPICFATMGAGTLSNLFTINSSQFPFESTSAGAFNSDGTLFAFVGRGDVNCLYLCSVSNSTVSLLKSQVCNLGAETGQLCIAKSIAFNKESNLIAIGFVIPNSGKQYVEIFSYQDGLLSHITTFRERATNCLFHPTKAFFIAGSTIYKIEENPINFLNYGTLYPGNGDPIAFAKNGKILYHRALSTSNDTYGGSIYVYTSPSNNGVYELSYEYEISGIANENDLNGGWAFLKGSYLYTFGVYGVMKFSNSFSFVKNYDNKTIFATQKDLIPDATIKYTEKNFSLTGTYDEPQMVEGEVVVQYINGDNIPLTETLLTLGNYSVTRNNNRLLFGSSESNSVIIPQNISTAIISIQAGGFPIVKFGDLSQQQLSYEAIPNVSLASVALSGQQVCDYVYITKMTVANLDDYNPVWDNNTLFFTHFDQQSLQAGQIGFVSASMEIYRENVETGNIQKLYSLAPDTTKIRDYSWLTNTPYKYYAYGKLGNKYTSQKEFNATKICKKQDSYILLITEQDEEQPNSYHVVASWRFGNNIAAGSVSNNNSPAFLTNFTGYRLKQPTARKGKSGTLQALLSNVSQCKYVDTALQMENLYAISECRNPMFIKDMKGNLYMVTISAPITQTINTKSPEQRVTVSIPWEEIDNANDVSIIQTPNDQGWVGDNSMLALVRFTVDPDTGMLQVVYPTSYSGTTFSLPRTHLLANTPEDMQIPNIDIEDNSVVLKTKE